MDKTVVFALEIISLVVSTLVLLATFAISALAGSNDAQKYGFENNTANVSDMFYTQVTPAGYTFAIWGIIYVWQALWTIYAWSFVCRPNATRTISTGVYWAYAVANSLSIAWLYAWGNEHINFALPLLILFNVFIYSAIGMLWVHFYRVTSEVKSKVDLVLTWALPVNGVMLYATWTTIASLINLAVVVQYSEHFSAVNSGMISLVLLSATVLTYFILENTVFDRFTRYVFSVYPVIIWALIGELEAHWKQDNHGRNGIFTLVLLIVVIGLAVVRIGLLIYTWNRPVAVAKYKKHQRM